MEEMVRGGGNCTVSSSEKQCGAEGFCSEEGECICTGKWTGPFCSVTFKAALGPLYHTAMSIFLTLSCIWLLCSVLLLFLGRFQVRRRPLWVYYQHLSSIFVFFAAVSRCCYVSMGMYENSNGADERLGTSVTMRFLFGIFYPLLVSSLGLQVLTWNEIIDTGRRRNGTIFHVLNFSLFLGEVVFLGAFVEVTNSKIYIYLGLIWRVYTMAVFCVCFSGLGYFGMKALKDYQFSTWSHPDPLMGSIVPCFFGLMVFLVFILAIWCVDISYRIQNNYMPLSWLAVVYVYQILEFFGCLLLCYIMYSIFPKYEKQVASTEVAVDRPAAQRINAVIQRRRVTSRVRGDLKRSQSERMFVGLHRSTHSTSPLLSKRSDVKKYGDDMVVEDSNDISPVMLDRRALSIQENEKPFAWDVNDVNFSAYYEVCVKQTDMEESLSSHESGDSDLNDSDIEDLLECQPEDSFSNYWAI